MPKPLNVIHVDGSVKSREVMILAYLLILASLAYVTAFAINDFMQALIGKYIKKDNLFAYALYAAAAVALLLLVIYLGCWWHPPVIGYMDLSPI